MSEKVKKPIYKRVWFWVVVVLVVFGVIGTINDSEESALNESVIKSESLNDTESIAEKQVGIGIPFACGDFEVTVNKIYFGVVNNQFSEHHGEYAILFNITVLNTSNSIGNIRYCRLFSPRGVELDECWAYFYGTDFSMSLADLLPGASGTYTIGFFTNEKSNPAGCYTMFFSYSYILDPITFKFTVDKNKEIYVFYVGK